jgi:hypothetical protein
MSAEGLRRVREITVNLASVVKGARLYQPGQQSVREMLERTYGFLNAFLEDYIYLELEIDAQGMTWEGRPLVQSGEQEFDFLFRFYRDGIRQITFVKGIPFAEMESFLNLVLQDCPADQDLATLGWRKNFLYIEFAVVEAFHRILQQDTDEEKKDVREEVDAWTALASRLCLDPAPDVPPSSEVAVEEIPPEAFTIRERDGNPPLDEARERAVEQVVARLLRALESPDEKMVQEAAKNLRMLTDILLRQADLEQLCRLLDLLPDGAPQPEVRELRGFLHGSDALARLAGHFLQEEKWPEYSMALFCNRLGDDSLLLFLRPLLAAPQEKLDRLLDCLMRFRGEVMARLGREMPASRLAGLLDLAREAGGDTLLDAFAGHREGAARLEILRRRVAVTDAHLEAALKDPDRGVRMHALSLISRERRAALVPSLLDGIRQEGFAVLDPHEKEKWVVVAAMTAREQAEEFFIGFLETKGLFTSAREEEMKALAARALGIIGGEKALPALQRESKRITSSPRVRQSCSISRDVLLKKKKKDP